MAEKRTSREGRYFYLTRAQLFILAIVFIIASTLFFFLGILIGQSIEERKLVHREEPVVKIPIQPNAGIKQDKEEEMTFYDTLTDGDQGEARRSKGVAGTDNSGSTAVATNSGVAPSWSVQVTAFQNKDDAMHMASKLEGEGYSAFVVSGQVKGKTWHRVRVGRYASKEQAMQALQKLKDVDRYRNAIITRDD
jgi:cell division protein FtsN